MGIELKQAVVPAIDIKRKDDQSFIFFSVDPKIFHHILYFWSFTRYPNMEMDQLMSIIAC